MPSSAFELDRFTADDDRLEVAGRWLGVRGRRFVRPSLTAYIDGNSTRALAELEHKPWAAEDGDEWVAAFPWSGRLDEIEEFELAVAPDLSVRLPPPDAVIEEVVLPVVVPDDQAASAPAERAPQPPRGEAQELREQADAVRHNALAVRDRALEDLDEAIAARDRLRAELDEAIAARDRLRAELEHAAADRGRLTAELDHSIGERDRLRAERDRLVAERDRLRAELDRTVAERNRAFKDLDRAAADRARLNSQHDAELGRVRAELRMAQSDLALQRRPQSPDARSEPVLATAAPPPPPGHRAPAPALPWLTLDRIVAVPRRRGELHRPETWSVRALVIALMIAAVIALVIVLTSGPASVAP